MLDFERILVLSPHADDGEIGAGGTISRFIEKGASVYHVVFSCCEASVPQSLPDDILRQECLASSIILEIPSDRLIIKDYDVRTFPSRRQDILEDMVKLNRDINPQLILAPSSSDIHQDHQVIYRESLRAFKTSATIWGYEHPWNNLSFTTDVFMKLEERHIEKKVMALSKYKSQNFRPYFNKEYIKSLASTRGTQVQVSFAEVFELSRLIVG
jgi:LmbE family N-acetylglucosaminyl deacetylase